MFMYCPKCGQIAKQSKVKFCAICETELKNVPNQYLSASGNLFLSQQVRNQFIKEVIEPNPQYDKDLAQQRDAIAQCNAQKHAQEVAQKVQAYNESKPMHRCPVCGSTNLSAISTVGKVAKISLLGVWGAGDLGKKRRCDSCGHKF